MHLSLPAMSADHCWKCLDDACALTEGCMVKQGRERENREGGLPACLTGLLNPQLAVDLPPPDRMKGVRLNNRELDKLVNNLGRNPATWRRSLLLHTWLQV